MGKKWAALSSLSFFSLVARCGGSYFPTKGGQFEKVAEASRHFDEYIKATLGSAEEDLARERFERRDDLGMSDIDQEAGSKKKTKKLYPSNNRRRGEELQSDY